MCFFRGIPGHCLSCSEGLSDIGRVRGWNAASNETCRTLPKQPLESCVPNPRNSVKAQREHPLCDGSVNSIISALCCGLHGRKKSVSAGAILPSSFLFIERSNPLSPDSFHNLSEKSQISTTQPSLVLFSSTSFLTLHRKNLSQKKLKTRKKSR